MSTARWLALVAVELGVRVELLNEIVNSYGLILGCSPVVIVREGEQTLETCVSARRLAGYIGRQVVLFELMIWMRCGVASRPRSSYDRHAEQANRKVGLNSSKVAEPSTARISTTFTGYGHFGRLRTLRMS